MMMSSANPIDRCVFFSRMGACRHGDGCTKLHYRPTSSPTVLFPMMYPNPLAMENLKHMAGTSADGSTYDFTIDKKFLRKYGEHFYKEVWETFMDLGRIAELCVARNLGDHLLGNVYIRFENPADAARIVKDIRAKKLHDIILLPELSPVMSFTDACCKEDQEEKCSRGAACNYLHILRVSRKLVDDLKARQDRYWRHKKEKAASGGGSGTSSSRDKDRDRDRDRDKDKDKDNDKERSSRDKDREKDRDRDRDRERHRDRDRERDRDRDRDRDKDKERSSRDKDREKDHDRDRDRDRGRDRDRDRDRDREKDRDWKEKSSGSGSKRSGRKRSRSRSN